MDGNGVAEIIEPNAGPVYVAAVAPARNQEPFDRSGPPSPPSRPIDVILSMNVDGRRMDTDAGLEQVAFSIHQVDGRERSPPRPATFRTPL